MYINCKSRITQSDYGTTGLVDLGVNQLKHYVLDYRVGVVSTKRQSNSLVSWNVPYKARGLDFDLKSDFFVWKCIK